ncbi:zinc finger protein [Sesbania bispinosa]|nr:zinc finger protein [Sesbania bispinosa]
MVCVRVVVYCKPDFVRLCSSLFALPCVKYEPWMKESPIIPSNPNYTQYCKDGPCEGLNVGDVQLNFEGADEIFGCSQGASRYYLEDGEIDFLLMDRNMPVKKSSSLIESAMEASSSIQRLRGFSIIRGWWVC